MAMFGRRDIFTDDETVDGSNILDVWRKARITHEINRSEIDYLYHYYKGNQPILAREKKVRPEINNKVVVNRAAEIVDFKCSYLLGEPAQYVSRGAAEGITEKVNRLNSYMLAEDKASADAELAFWFTVCGVGYRLVLPDEAGEEDEAPFELYTLDPRNCFLVKCNAVGNKPVVGFKYVIQENGQTVVSAYTPTRYFEIREGRVVKDEPHALGYIPIVEYPANETRMGAFEPVITLLDALNKMESNRLDGVEQFIQAIMVFVNCDIDSKEFQELKEQLALKIKSDSGSPANVYYLNEQLDQSQTQTLVDDLYNEVRTIVGLPSQGGESNSTSDTGSAVIMRQGWQLAEARAKQTELMFKKSEKQFLRIVLRICRDIGGLNLKLSEIEQKFNRRNYADILTKSQVLTTMLNNPKIDPEDAYAASGMFTDSVAAYQRGMNWYEKNDTAEVVPVAQGSQVQRDGDGQIRGGTPVWEEAVPGKRDSPD